MSPHVGVGGLDRQAEEGQAALGDDEHGQAGEREREHRRHHVGQDLAEQDAAVVAPADLGGQHELALGRRPASGAHHADEGGDREDRQREHHLVRAVAERAGDREGPATEPGTPA